MSRLSLRIGRRRAIVWGGLGVILALLIAIVAVGALRDQARTTSTPADGVQERSHAAGTIPQPSLQPDGAGNGEKAGGAAIVDVTAAMPLSHDRFLVRDGQLSMVVKKGRVDQTMAQVVAVTRGLGGYVLSSAVGTGNRPLTAGVDDSQYGAVVKGQPGDPSAPGDDNGESYAWLTVRIPADRFDDALLRIGRLGRVEQLSTSAQDATGQMIDLKARLTHYRAVLARLLTFLDKATSVGTALAVQNRIDQSQLTVEQLTAQLKQLEETVSYSTLSVSLSEKGTSPVAAHGNGFWQALQRSGHLLVSGTQGIIIAIGAALPFLILTAVVAALAVLAVRAVSRHRQSNGAPAPPAVPPQNV